MTLLDCAAALLLPVFLPPLMLGVIARTKARAAGRRGPPLLQPYFDLARLLRKGVVLSRTTSWVFLAGPVVAFVTALLAACIVPIGARGALISFPGDLIAFAYLLGLGRFFTIAAALDTGSAFEGMGASREAAFSCLAEPAAFFALLVLVKLSGFYSLGAMLGPELPELWARAAPSLGLATASLFVVLLAENSRIPFDDPTTHLELTMIHEVMVLDHSGPPFALALYGAALKLFAYGLLLVRIATPFHVDGAALGIGVAVAELLALSVLVGAVESVMARLPLLRVPSLLVGAGLLSAFGVMLLVG
ncbi:MAG: respiratory chain complex I subunit 1 family protein [Myxococcota bacterium]